MYFYELLGKCNPDTLTAQFMQLCSDAPDPDALKSAFRNVLCRLKQIKPHQTAHVKIVMQHVQTGKEAFDSVFAEYENDPFRHGLMQNPWADTLGFPVDDAALAEPEHFAARVLFEMTFLGFDEETIQQRLREWHE